MATNRLRKRLEGADEQTLSKMTENFCMVGGKSFRVFELVD